MADPLRPVGAGAMAAVVRNDLRLLRADPTVLILLIVTPVVIMSFTNKAFRYALELSGRPHATGAEQSVPGMTLMFSFALVGAIGYTLFREHTWRTFDRLRSAPIPLERLLAAKAVVPLGMVSCQVAASLAIGSAWFDLRIEGSVPLFFAVLVAYIWCVMGLALLLAGVCRTMLQLSTASNLGATLFAGLGGALVPLSTMPAWARALAPLSPMYWGMRGLGAGIYRDVGAASGVTSVGVLLATGLLTGMAGAVILRRKEGHDAHV